MKYIINVVTDLIAQYKTRDPFQLAEHLGISVFFYPFRKIKGLILEKDGLKYIGINSNLPRLIQKAIVAHELGHHILSTAGMGYFFMVEKTLFRVDKQERTANRFAAELLIGEEPVDYGETLEMFAGRLGIPVELVEVRYYR